MSEWPASGVLVTNQHVLTAAVNVHNYNRWDLGFGSEKQKNLHVVKSFNAYVHEQFNDTTDDNNVGLIVMPEPIALTGELLDRIGLVRHRNRELGNKQFSSSIFCRSNCPNHVASAKRSYSTRGRYRPYCRLHADQWRWSIVETSQSWSATNR